MIKAENHIFQGMKRDNHPIKQDGKFLWDAHNIRLTNRDDNTLLSITNERGTSDPLITFKGYYVGHCVLGKYLVLFTANNDGSENYIYRVKNVENTFRVAILYYIQETDRGWSPDDPIETLGIYETEFIQKVYWVDGKHQPRVVNIAKPEYILGNTKYEKVLELPLWDYSNSAPSDRERETINETIDPIDSVGDWRQFIDSYKEEYPQIYKEGSFDFVRDLDLTENVTVTKIDGQGEFLQGTIQYAFSYYNKYEQESNIWYTTPIQYISPSTRGASPEEKVPNSFLINIWGTDQNFDFVRIYSIHRTSLDAIPTVKVVVDLPSKLKDLGESIQYIDTGTTGYIIDPSQLLYIGGVSIIANCIAQKDQTLFLGGITQNELVPKDAVMDILSKADIRDEEYWSNSTSSTPSNTSVYYDYKPDLNSGYNAGFMPGETYRCGYQYQGKDGKWSEPIYYNDMVLRERPEWENLPTKESRALRFSVGQDVKQKLLRLGVKKIRTCVVFPLTSERDVICEGIVCPTVYSVLGRQNDAPYAMSSWFFRPATNIANIDNDINIFNGASIQFQHNKALFSGANRGAEIQNMLTGVDTISDVNQDNLSKYTSQFFVDENIVTFHSPDLEFDTSLSNYNWDNVTLEIVGMARLGAISGDIDIQTSSPTRGTDSIGFIHKPFGYQTHNNIFVNGGLVMTTLYRDVGVTKDTFEPMGDAYWAIYPWHRSGSLNNDSRRPPVTKDTDTGTQSAILLKKKISNLKFFDFNVPLGEGDDSIRYNISTPQLFNSNEVTMLKLKPSYLQKEVPYYGNVDTLITTPQEYPLYNSQGIDKSIQPVGGNVINSSKDPVRMKYKSSPHLVFSLGDSLDTIPLLPRHRATGADNLSSNNFLFPSWQQSGSTDGSTADISKYDYILWEYSEADFMDIAFLSQKIAPENQLGRCCIYKLSNSKYVVTKIERHNKGPQHKNITKVSNGLILKATSGITVIGNTMLPGTNINHYKKKVYIGPDKYYKINYTENSFSLEPVTQPSNVQAEENTSTAKTYKIAQMQFGVAGDDRDGLPYLLIGMLKRPSVVGKFGGKSEEALKQNLWLPASEPVVISDNDQPIIVPFEFGDTWYSRYDCLKTYPFTREDENQLVEIGSFMCETRVNIDGRYDRNRGQLSNINMSPQNFNLFNPIYSQMDNFFNYRIIDKDFYRQPTFANQITWSKEKHSGEETDTWTNINLANTLDLDGDKGAITSIKSWNDSIFCFQQKAFSQILFNSRTQIPVEDGVPIEISNGYKVSGKRYFSDEIGCNNKWSIISTPKGIYFIDSNTNGLYLFNGQLTNLSKGLGMDWWVKQIPTSTVWKPIDIRNSVPNGIRSFYDTKYGDIYFSPGQDNLSFVEQPEALCYSEQLEQFTSFMSYGGVQAMFNIGDNFYSLKHDGSNIVLYQNNIGDYNYFFGEYKPFSLTFISNDNPTYTKIFDTVELRSDVFTNDIINSRMPFTSIEASNEYQKSGICNFEDSPESIKKKFRVWRINIPRVSEVASRHELGGDTLRSNYGRARIRNPWAKITLVNEDGYRDKVILHDLSVKYTI